MTTKSKAPKADVQAALAALKVETIIDLRRNSAAPCAVATISEQQRF